jgi:glycosyltransferase involved in cell wall biosynthesis
MKVSIVIPTYNCAELVGTTLRSIQQGGHEEIEVILMDGGSRDDIAEVVASFGSLVSVFVSEPDNGHYDAINKEMSRATGEILCWINGGDFFIPGAIENAVSVFAASPNAEWIAGRPCRRRSCPSAAGQSRGRGFGGSSSFCVEKART